MPNQTKTVGSINTITGVVTFTDGTNASCTTKAWRFAQRVEINDTVEVGYNKEGQISLIKKAGEFTPEGTPTGTFNTPTNDFVLKELTTIKTMLQKVMDKLGVDEDTEDTTETDAMDEIVTEETLDAF